MPEEVIAGEFAIDRASQLTFARMTGDWNPVHVDDDYARRTSFGQPVVHGIHVLLRALDLLCAKDDPRWSMPSEAWGTARLAVQFVQPVFLNDPLRLVWIGRDARRIRFAVRTGHVDLAKFTISPGELKGSLNRDAPLQDRPDGYGCTQPIEQRMDEGAELSFAWPIALPAEQLRASFSNLAQELGLRAVAEIALLSTVVGMGWPGLRSLFAEAKIALHAPASDDTGALDIRVETSDPRHRLTVLRVTGIRTASELTAFFRPGEILQPGMQALRPHVHPDRYAGWTALIIGGSRGIGEICAKLAAAGGADVILTYRSKPDEAARVRDDISAGGGSCRIMRHDVSESTLDLPPEWLANRRLFVFFSASPQIFRRRTALYDRSWLDEFTDVFVDGLVRLYGGLREKTDGLISLIYPSTEALEKPMVQLIEYAAAKAAGEAVCLALASSDRKLRVAIPRLPRLPTDQTNSIVAVEAADPVQVLIPLLDSAMADEARPASDLNAS